MSTISEAESCRTATGICEKKLAAMPAIERIRWALDVLPGEHMLSSSFGAQAAVMLHLTVSAKPDIPVVVIDTGYLFPETYRFIDELAVRLDLNLHVYRPAVSAAWQEARYGKRWRDGVAGLEAYHRDNKIEPMERALDELAVGTWFAGLRRTQSRERARTPFIETSGERWKVHPIADWSDRQVHFYLKEHGLPYHPLWHEGYVSIGDVHTTRPITEVASAEEVRFFGLRRECGLHEMDFGRTG
ncbi:MAG: phosphoadenylyl-sulfate reductase [Woeseiaceae bacterium]|nr:phosphoadenylyl-sulfate reductase [Woeseiaceae bacterium]